MISNSRNTSPLTLRQWFSGFCTTKVRPAVVQKPLNHRNESGGGWLFAFLVLLFLTGCAQEMDNQARVDPQEPTPFFENQRALPAHTVAASPSTLSGLNSHAPIDKPLLSDDPVVNTGRKNDQPVETIPDAVLEHTTYTDLLQRGRERFGISCVPCHDSTGSGNGMAVRRGFPYPPTYHSDRLRSQPIGHIFIQATEGGEKMPPYGDLISVEDRWAIAAYVRALQFSQHAPVGQLDDADRTQLEAAK